MAWPRAASGRDARPAAAAKHRASLSGRPGLLPALDRAGVTRPYFLYPQPPYHAHRRGSNAHLVGAWLPLSQSNSETLKASRYHLPRHDFPVAGLQYTGKGRPQTAMPAPASTSAWARARWLTAAVASRCGYLGAIGVA